MDFKVPPALGSTDELEIELLLAKPTPVDEAMGSEGVDETVAEEYGNSSTMPGNCDNGIFFRRQYNFSGA
ncbi:hypothetical protein IBA8401_29290 [Pseudomonas syringae]